MRALGRRHQVGRLRSTGIRCGGGVGSDFAFKSGGYGAPQPDVWSPLEYGAHVRDVYRLFDARLVQMLTEDNPTFGYWNQDETASNDRYSEQDPEVVADE